MIIFFNKKSGEIYGTVNGRIHTKEELNTIVQPQEIDQKDIGKKVFSLEETKEIEKAGFRVMTKKVLLEKDEFVGFADADIVEAQKPDAVETILIDLTKPLSEIEANFSQTTRQLIKKSNNMIFRELGFNDRQIVLSVIEEVEKMKDIKLAKQILQIRAPFLDGLRRMYVVEDEQKAPLAVALITCFNNGNFTYSLGGVTLKGRNTHAGDFLIWELIKDAKELRYKTFDFGGIYADWASDEKKKVNEFKTRWGGKRVAF